MALVQGLKSVFKEEGPEALVMDISYQIEIVASESVEKSSPRPTFTRFRDSAEVPRSRHAFFCPVTLSKLLTSSEKLSERLSDIKIYSSGVGNWKGKKWSGGLS
ncbi:hypothetical protein EVAR_6818_1 [Eumeta japonica]|uniref:Uncharacterized protein n=1 Tax=Eumeta variegata TaxID=151549 RepID=A0A4C1U7N2_EUMVA|nr:hypothetical protein EVAR_6818_1 [Eumeta japonica]